MVRGKAYRISTHGERKRKREIGSTSALYCTKGEGNKRKKRGNKYLIKSPDGEKKFGGKMGGNAGTGQTYKKRNC